ncbi:ClpXP protease specificity-enhancing factor [Xylophilus sp. Kf1]|nr:ClpXP protease specificity-enhancing factor [Xylophilus sp. Kf1]
MNAIESHSTRPYLLRALYEWCTDNGLTPYVAVAVDDTVQVPREYVKDGEIVLNISYDATSGLKVGNQFIEFKARFAGVPRDIMVPIGRVMAIYARENGQGMAFPLLEPVEPATPSVASLGHTNEDHESRSLVQLVPGDGTREAAEGAEAVDSGEGVDPPKPPGAGNRPSLKRIK